MEPNVPYVSILQIDVGIPLFKCKQKIYSMSLYHPQALELGADMEQILKIDRNR